MRISCFDYTSSSVNMCYIRVAVFLLAVTACCADIDNIFGGEPAEDGEFNFAVRVELRLNKPDPFFVICTGILLNNRTVMTVPYCIPTNGSQIENATIRVTGGLYNSSDPMSTAQTRRVESYIIHPKYKLTNETANSIIALLFLKTPFNATDNPRLGFVEKFSTRSLDKKALESSKVYIAGFGNTNSSIESKPDVLHKLKTSFLTNEKCMEEAVKLNFSKLTKKMICTLKPGAGPCGGDGGGLVGYYTRRKFVLVSLTAFGIGSGCADSLNVGMRMSYYKKWIRENIDGDGAETMF